MGEPKRRVVTASVQYEAEESPDGSVTFDPKRLLSIVVLAVDGVPVVAGADYRRADHPWLKPPRPRARA